MRGLDKSSKEYKAMKSFVLKIREVKREVTSEDLDKEDAITLTKMYDDYSRGTIACFMTEVMQDLGIKDFGIKESDSE